MKSLDLIAVYIVIFLLLSTSSLAQDYDLIVTTNGDSIACHIDSLTDSHIYFEMKSQNTWTHTQIDLSSVTRHERNAIHKGQYLFKSGTSIIKSVYSGKLPKNSIYAGIMGFHIFNTNPSSEENNSTSGISVRIGYRFQSRSGFLFRAAPVICFVDGGVVLLPALSIGFSF